MLSYIDGETSFRSEGDGIQRMQQHRNVKRRYDSNAVHAIDMGVGFYRTNSGLSMIQGDLNMNPIPEKELTEEMRLEENGGLISREYQLETVTNPQMGIWISPTSEVYPDSSSSREFLNPKKKQCCFVCGVLNLCHRHRVSRHV